LLLALAMLPLAACDDDITSSNPFDAEESFSLKVDAAGVTVIDVNGINGGIVITGSATADSITVAGVKRVDAETQEAADTWLDSLEVQVTEASGSVAVTTVQPTATQGRNFVVDYEIVIPENVRVVIENANGGIAVTALEAPVDIDNANGAILLDDIVGNVTVDLGNGAVSADVTLPASGQIDITVGNGDIELSIPDTTSAEFSAAVGNGTITMVGLTLQNQVSTSTSLTGTLGAGDGTIQLSTGNGTITVTGF
jgi:DUF4097 and DUF4098 domain-containing protein YvlB